MKWIGLTGGIASGKSTVAQLIESRGFKVIDADRISHQLTQIGQDGYNQILQSYGESILDSELKLDRKKLGEIIFNNQVEKQKLESILHPLIKEKVREIKNEELKNKTEFLFYDVPLLFEKNLQNDFDFVVTVWCDEETQKKRLTHRNKLSLDQVEIRIKSQWPLIDKVAQSKYCIDNSGSEIDLMFLVDQFLFEITGQKFK